MSQSTAHHVGITVDDLDAMAEFYGETLNLPVAERFRVEGEGFATAVDVEGASADFVHFDADGCRMFDKRFVAGVDAMKLLLGYRWQKWKFRSGRYVQLTESEYSY